jgi:Family of unknown function (DUF6882)
MLRFVNRVGPRRAEKLKLRPRAPWNGERVDIDRFWAESWRELGQRQAHIAEHHRLASAQWSVDQDAALIHFERADGARLVAPVQIIGAWNPRSSAFLWGWDHPSVATRLRADAERTRWFGDKHELNELTQRSLRVSELEAWRLAAVALKVNGAAGVYRGPTEGPVVFMTMGDLRALT